MAKYQRTMMTSGAWLKAAELKSGTRAKIVSETKSQPSQFLNKDGSPKTQDVCKIQIEGAKEPMNVSLNRATINGLIDAFGDDSLKWQGNYLTVETERVRVAGKTVVALYLIPQGFKKADDQNGYAMIIKADNNTSENSIAEEPLEEDLQDNPF